MTVADVKKTTEQKMNKSIETLKADLAKVRTGRAHIGILDHVKVDYYGNPTQVSQVANITLIDARTIGVQPWEKKMVGAIEKAIRESDLGLNPATQGDLIRVPTPPLTEERRKEFVKVVKHMAEDGRVAVRNLRRDARKTLEHDERGGEISADELERAEKELEKITHEHVESIDAALGRKEAELLEV